MVYAMARIVVCLSKLDEVLEILTSLQQRTSVKSGCIRCNVYRDVDDENSVVMEEIWRSEQDLANHLRSDEYQKILLLAEMASAPPEIKFYTITHAAGVEEIVKARAAGGERGRLE